MIITHHHGDHAGCLADVAKQVNAAIYAGEADVASITSPTALRPVKDDDVFGLRIIATHAEAAQRHVVRSSRTVAWTAGSSWRCGIRTFGRCRRRPIVGPWLSCIGRATP